MIPGRTTPFPVTLKVRVGTRDAQRLPLGDHALGMALFGRLESRIEKGRTSPVGLAIDAERVLEYDLDPLARTGGDLQRFLSAVAGGDPVDLLALLAVLRLKGSKGMTAVTFLEWPDGRWWSAMRPLVIHPNQAPIDPVIRSAEDGCPKPGGMGGWFSRARVEKLCLKLDSPPVRRDLVH